MQQNFKWCSPGHPQYSTYHANVSNLLHNRFGNGGDVQASSLPKVQTCTLFLGVADHCAGGGRTEGGRGGAGRGGKTGRETGEGRGGGKEKEGKEGSEVGREGRGEGGMEGEKGKRGKGGRSENSRKGVGRGER